VLKGTFSTDCKSTYMRIGRALLLVLVLVLLVVLAFAGDVAPRNIVYSCVFLQFML